MVSGRDRKEKGIDTFGSFARITSTSGCLDSVFADIVLVFSIFCLRYGKVSSKSARVAVWFEGSREGGFSLQVLGWIKWTSHQKQ